MGHPFYSEHWIDDSTTDEVEYLWPILFGLFIVYVNHMVWKGYRISSAVNTPSFPLYLSYFFHHMFLSELLKIKVKGFKLK